jgi:hypothetical protein
MRVREVLRGILGVKDDFARYIAYCEGYRAETHILPVGLHAGYCSRLEWGHIQRWIQNDMCPVLLNFLRRPTISVFFHVIRREVDLWGVRRWRNLPLGEVRA